MNKDGKGVERIGSFPQDELHRHAYTDMIRQYSKQLFNFGYRFCPDEDIVKDCIQQLYLDLWNRRFDISETTTIKAYLFKAIRNRVLREKNKWLKNNPLNDDYSFTLDFSVEHKLIADIADRELAEKVKKILQALPERQREIIYLKFFEGLDTQQISMIMNINKQSAHNLLQKAYHSIRSEWGVLTFLAAALHLHRT